MAAPASTAIQKTPTPTLVKIGNRALSAHGYRRDIAEEHLKDHLGKPESQRWCSMACAARTFFGRDSQANRVRMRKRLPKLFSSMLDHGLFLVIEYAPYGTVANHRHHGEATTMKIYQNDQDGLNKQHAEAQVARMVQRRQLAAEKAAKALALLEPPPPSA